MYASHYRCSSCGEKFQFPFQAGYYYLGDLPLAEKVGEADLLPALLRPVWCIDCDTLSIAEDIKPLRVFEDAFGHVRAGGQIEYPFFSYNMDIEDAKAETGRYLRWRMERRHAARALCCGGSNFQNMDDPQVRIQHADCEFSSVAYLTIDSHSGPSNVPLNIRTYDIEGELIGHLTRVAFNGWYIEPAAYSARPDDDEPDFIYGQST